MRLLASLLTFAVAGTSLALTLTPALLIGGSGAWLINLLLAPLVFSTLLVGLSGLASRPFWAGNVRGRFPRLPDHPVYRKRIFYGALWTGIFYCKPVYGLALYCAPLKRLLFRGFGYRGSLDFTVHPDAWIRDISMLELGAGAYISNRATVATNMVLIRGEILVAPIRIGRGSVIGHLAAVAPGVSVGEDSEIGISTMVGLRTVIGDRVNIGPRCGIGHGIRIGSDVTIGISTTLGDRVRVGDGIVIKPFVHVPPGTRLSKQADADALEPSSMRVPAA